MRKTDETRALLALSVALTLAACGGDDGPVIEGTYDTTSAWTVRSPLGEDRTLGDTVAELLVEEVAQRLPIPDRVEGRVQSALDDTLGDRVRADIDGGAPAALAPDGDLSVLRGTLLTFDVESVIELERDDGLRGTETVSAVSFVIDDRLYRVTPDDLRVPGGPAPTLGAELRARRGGGGLVIAPHPYELHLGELVRWLAAQLVGEVAFAEIEAALDELLDCDRLVSVLTRDALSVRVAGRDFDIAEDVLVAACGVAMGVLEDRVAGLLSVDAFVEVGGRLEMIDDDGDRVIDSLVSEPEYGGVVTLYRPAALAPQIDVALTAARR